MLSGGAVKDRLIDAVGKRPGSTAPELLRVLKLTGVDVDKKQINSVLYAERDAFSNDGGSPPRWRLWLAPSPSAEASGDSRSSAATSGAPPLFAWQAEALEAWRARRSQGVVEAVTGTGKTMVGLAAAAAVLDDGGKVQILVPTVELLRQWERQLRAFLPRARVGKLGGGSSASLVSCDVLVAVVNSARGYRARALPKSSLLIADECHRYGSQSNAKALNPDFARRLGLSATYARSDDGNAEHLDPYFGSTCYRIDYARAIADEVTAHFKVALVGVRFTGQERELYKEASDSASKARGWLVANGEVPAEPFGEFIKQVSLLAKESGGSQATWKARQYLSAFHERRRLLAETHSKREKLAELVPALRAADRSIVFTQTIEAAKDSVAIMRSAGIEAASVHSELAAAEREGVLRRFAQGRLSAIAAPQVLDEGVDVPAADLAVIVAASRTRRQMIQRMGRVLRRKADGRLARFVVMYVEGTTEDPKMGAHEDFLGDVTSVADSIEHFAPGSASERICDFLNRFAPTRQQPPPKLAEARSATSSPPPRPSRRDGKSPGSSNDAVPERSRLEGHAGPRPAATSREVDPNATRPNQDERGKSKTPDQRSTNPPLREGSFALASRRAIGRVLKLPGAAPDAGWRYLGVCELECAGCEWRLRVVARSKKDVFALCRECGLGWSIEYYDDPTKHELRAFFKEVVGRPAKEQRRRNERAERATTRVKLSRLSPNEPYSEPSDGPGRLPTGDGPRSRPREAIPRSGY